jgi:hypothetical protein
VQIGFAIFRRPKPLHLEIARGLRNGYTVFGMRPHVFLYIHTEVLLSAMERIHLTLHPNGAGK